MMCFVYHHEAENQVSHTQDRQITNSAHNHIAHVELSFRIVFSSLVPLDWKEQQNLSNLLTNSHAHV